MTRLPLVALGVALVGGVVAAIVSLDVDRESRDDAAVVTLTRANRSGASIDASDAPTISTESAAPRDVDAQLRRLEAANEQLRSELAATRRKLHSLADDLDETRRVAAEARSVARAHEPAVCGAWLHSVDGGGAWTIDLADDGTLRDAAGAPTGKWTRTGSSLVLRWPNGGAPGGGEWIDTLVVASDGASYVGTNQRGSVIRGSRPR